MKYRVLKRTDHACEVEFHDGQHRIVLNIGPFDENDPHYVSDRWPHHAFVRREGVEFCPADLTGPDWTDYAPSRHLLGALPEKLRVARNEEVFDHRAVPGPDLENSAGGNVSRRKQLCVSNLFFNVMCFRAGDIEETHHHPFNHVSFVVGKFILTLEGKSTVIEGTVTDPLLLFVARMKRHRFACLEPGFIACCHAQRMSENVEDILDDALVPNGDLPPELLKGAYPLTVSGPADKQGSPLKFNAAP